MQYLSVQILLTIGNVSLIPKSINIESGDMQQNSVVPTEDIQVHKLHHFTRHWLLSIISYVLDEGFSHLKPKFSLYCDVPVEHL